MKKPYHKPTITKHKLSTRQANILRFIAKHNNETGYPPTIREIGKACDINSTSVVNYNLNRLVKFGLIERTYGLARAVRLISRAGEVA